MTDTRRNPNRWSDEALDVFWTTYLEITDSTLAEVFHHPEFYSRSGFWEEKDLNKINNTIAWNAAWVAADAVDFR